MTQKVNYFQKMLEHQHPDLYHRVGISVESISNYFQYRGVDGRVRAELNYNSPVKYKYVISFPNVDSLYYDMCFYIDYMWGGNVDVIASFDFDGTNHFKFTV
jgi:hypothetical protein